MITRTEEQKLTKAQVVFKLGESTYSVPMPTIRIAAEWRKLLVAKLSQLTAGTVAPSEVLKRILTINWIEYPSVVCDLVFGFAKELDAAKEEILDSATDEQMIIALECIMDINVRPFTAQMSSVLESTRANLGRQ